MTRPISILESTVPFFALTLAALLIAVSMACSGGPTDGGGQAQPDVAAAPDAARSVREALGLVEGVYARNFADIQQSAPAGQFRLSGEGPLVTADLTYLAGRVDVLLDESKDPSSRLSVGSEAALFLVAGYGTTQRPEFSMAAHTVLEYVRRLLDGAPPAAVRAGQDAELARLEQQLTAFEIACGCR